MMPARCPVQPLNSLRRLRPAVKNRLVSPFLVHINRVSGVPIAKRQRLPQNTALRHRRDGAWDARSASWALERVGFHFSHVAFGIGDRFNKVNQCTTHFRVFNAGESAIELQTVWRLQNGLNWSFFSCGCAILFRACRPFWQSIEEKHGGHPQNLSNLSEPACGHAVGAFFIFLNLLERQSQIPPKFFLAHTKQYTPHAHSAADMDVDWMWLSSHLVILPPRLLGPIAAGFSTCIIFGIHSFSQSQISYNTDHRRWHITFQCYRHLFHFKSASGMVPNQACDGLGGNVNVPTSELVGFLSLMKDVAPPMATVADGGDYERWKYW